jgi:curli biogenesis system outer membrane secretion channel CsgG
LKKRLGNILCSAALIAMAAVCALIVRPCPLAAEKKRIAVLPFKNESQMHDSFFGNGLDDHLNAGLFQTKTYEIIDRSSLDAVLKEQRLGATGIIDPQTAVKIGKILGVDYLVIGNIIYAGIDDSLFLNTGAKVSIAVRMIDVATGEIIFAEKADGRKNASKLLEKYSNRYNLNLPAAKFIFAEAAQRAVGKIVDALYDVNPLEGYVVAIDGREAIIDLGREHGIAKGQTFIVYRAGEVIRHPVTGAVVGVKRMELASIKITEVDAATSIGSLSGEDKDLVRPGDKIRKKVS